MTTSLREQWKNRRGFLGLIIQLPDASYIVEIPIAGNTRLQGA
jgi:hypothetical protein